DVTRADGGARPAHCRVVGGHEAWRPGQAGKPHARKATAAQIVIGSAVARIDPRLYVFWQFHCLVSFVRRSASHGFALGLTGSLSNSSLTPSGIVMAVTGLPLASACLTSVRMLGLRVFGGRAASGAGQRAARSSADTSRP